MRRRRRRGANPRLLALLLAVVAAGVLAALVVAVPALNRGESLQGRGPVPTPTVPSSNLALAPVQLALREGRWADAAQLARAAGSGFDSAPIATAEAFALVRLGRLTDAVAAAERAVTLNAADGRAHAALAHALDWSNRYDAALPAARRAVELAPTDAWVAAIHAEVLADVQRFELARDEALRAVQLDVGEPLARRSLGYSLERLGNYPRALEEYQAALDLAPGWAFVLLDIAPVLNTQGRRGEAEATLDRFAGLAPRDPRGPGALGLIQYQAGQFDLALATMRRALALDPGYAPGFRISGWAQYSLRRYDDAVVNFERSLELEPRNDSAMTGLGWTNLSLGRLERARELFEAALVLRPGNSLAQQGLQQARERLAPA